MFQPLLGPAAQGFFGHWIAHHPVPKDESVVVAYVLDVLVSNSTDVTIRVTADQQFELYLDGVKIGRTSESGTPATWFYETYDIHFSAGHHTLSAKVWSWAGEAATAQMSVAHGFLLATISECHSRLLSTGHAPWKSKLLPGYSFTGHLNAPNGWTGVPPSQTLDCRIFPWDWSDGAGEGWTTPTVFTPSVMGGYGEPDVVRLLCQASLPPSMLSKISTSKACFVSCRIESSRALAATDDLPLERGLFDQLLNGSPITLPSGFVRRIVVDLGGYYCGWPRIECQGGSGGRIRLTWAESLFDHPEGMEKGRRNIIFDKYFRGVWDEFFLDGSSRTLETLTWRAGRFLEIVVDTGWEPLDLYGLSITETRYPLDIAGQFSSDSEKLDEIFPIVVRSLEVSSHDNFVDCPYYERMCYPGDCRIEALTAYASTIDSGLARKAVGLFASSDKSEGLCMARWPSRIPLYIPSFSLWWVCMVYDFARWRGDRDFIYRTLDGVRSTLEYFFARADSDGLTRGDDEHWNFFDWVPEWRGHPWGGAPAFGQQTNAIINWLFVYTLHRAAEIEDYAGDPRRGVRLRREAGRIVYSLRRKFWNEERQLFADDRDGRSFSEHSQILAILSGSLPIQDARGLFERMLSTQGLSKVSLFFTHYLIEACAFVGREDVLFEKLFLWSDFIKQGFVTVPENFDHTRSDCHGWGAHPLFHLIANVAGIQPGAMGFTQVRIAPKFGNLKKVSASCPHPAGTIRVNYQLHDTTLVASITLPSGVSGELLYGMECYPLRPGSQMLQVARDLAYDSGR